ncbi:uncharacterized protein LOC135343327 [Halichondria panicea]|uniref:uncharacterized protein LOC135343327 n=1 Tax=Halichondria panicea TaxID=6063 RepID=UPI00312B2D4A
MLYFNRLALPTLYRGLWLDGDPIAYNDVLITYPSNCTQPNILARFTVCDYSVVLGDGAIIPSPPDLNSSSYFRHFITWNRDSLNSFIDFDLTTATAGITAIELSFFNSPANRISLPDITISVVHFGTVSPIASWIFDNEHLDQTDNQIRTISIRPFRSLSAVNLRIRFQFTVFHDFDWVFLSEVRFCTDLQLNLQPEVIFQMPPSNNIQPDAEDLRRGSTELVCTVSSEGSYTWQWKKDNVIIVNKEDYRITIGDGSRTTKLTINNLDFSDAAKYECTGMTRRDANVMNSAVYVLEFPGT